MSAPLHRPWTQEQFLAWDGHQQARHEFDGFQPIAMTGTANHSIIMRNLHRSLDTRLRGSNCEYLGPDAGLATAGAAIRYPDALVTCSKFAGSARTIPGVVVVFEIVSPTSGHTDRIVKVGEYAVVPSIRRYVIIESTSIGLTVFERPDGTAPWTALTLTDDADVLNMPEIGIEIPAGQLYANVDFTGSLDESEFRTR